VRLIKEIYEQQVKDGVDVADISSLNTDTGAMCLAMKMFLYHQVEENALGQLSVAANKDKRCQTGLSSEDGVARVSVGLQVITDGYTIGPECLDWDRRTRVEREMREMEKAKSGVLAREFLKEQVEHVVTEI
jgi:hypothetical protein